MGPGQAQRHRTGAKNTKQKSNPKNKKILRINLKHKITVFKTSESTQDHDKISN